MNIKLTTNVYPLEAILNACYVFIDRAYIFLDADAKGMNIKVNLKGKKELSSKEMDALKGDFMNELLHAALRFTLNKNNKKIREYIIGRALYSDIFSSSLLSDKSGNGDFKDDPLGIAIPWEKKHSKKHAKSKV